MNNFSSRCDALVKDVMVRLSMVVSLNGINSSFSCKAVLAVPDAQAFNLEGGRYLKEVSGNEIIDNEGYEYDYSCLSVEQLSELVDVLEV